TQRLPWALILIGALISITLEIIGVQALPVAVGIYLPISTSAAIFSGGLVRAIVERLRKGGSSQPSTETTAQESLAAEETGKGVLLSSGLIAGGAIGGLLVAAGRVFLGGEESMGIGTHSWIATGPWSNTIALVVFGGLGLFLFLQARHRKS
ncbi:MAG: oligopeptide transporter, OPT family, partial [Acidobacteria bacterium]|nr:oligopeptide transporter, OPT family [Acidobacteriota bacterium]